MRVKEVTKKDIENRFIEMNDYMKIEYLKSCLKNHLDFDTRKFVLVKLSGLFEAKGMFLDAGRMMKSAAEINTNRQTKINDFVKAVELFVRGGSYDDADVVTKKAFSLADEKRIGEMGELVKDFYRIQAKVSVERSKRKQAIDIYERLLTLNLIDDEKEEVQQKLLDLYGGVGEMNKYRNLKRKISGLN
ncbi:MAG: hypothetical protein ABIH92_00345 [Nanoarchaeota archaeon]